MTADKITFYNATICPYAQRAAIALKEAGAEYETVNIDLLNKPDWYGKINPELKVPAFTVGDQNIAESLVIIEYVNDLFPEKNLLPKDPLTRAYVRYFIEFFATKITSEFFKYVFNHKGENAFQDYEKNINTAFERLNELLVQQSSSGPYFLGNEYSLADVAIAPFVGRIFAFNNLFLDGYKFEAFKQYPRIEELFNGVTNRPSFKETFCGDQTFIDYIGKRFNVTKQ